MKTIEQINKERESVEPKIYSFYVQARWEPSGIMCNCGCKDELLFLDPNTQSNKSFYADVKCKATGKVGVLEYDGSIKQIIVGIKWK